MEGIIIGLGILFIGMILAAGILVAKYVSPLILVVGCIWLMAACLAHNGMQALVGISIIVCSMVYYGIGAAFDR